tara:strand:- start:228 stop:632 length:405 start_codon:yes stop_codon:yes gene_type:complete
MSMTIDKLHLRPAQLLLHWDYNPTFAEEYNHISRTGFVKMVGLIPDFFVHAVTEEDLDIASIADAMDDAYGMGGFRNTFSGSISADGVYSSDGDPDLVPLVALSADTHVTCYIYNYGIVGLRDGHGNVRIGRFD